MTTAAQKREEREERAEAEREERDAEREHQRTKHATATDPFVLPEGQADGPPEGTETPSGDVPEGTVFTHTLADNELVAHVPNGVGGYHQIKAGIGADPKTFAAHIAATLSTIHAP